MNASLQCMSNCYELTNYFLESYYKQHINLTNPMGSKGVLVEAYADLIIRIWTTTDLSINPFKFKQAFEKLHSIVKYLI